FLETSCSTYPSVTTLLSRYESGRQWILSQKTHPRHLPMVGRWQVTIFPRTGRVQLPHAAPSSHWLTKTIGVIKLDPWLSPFQDSLKRRYAKAQDWMKTIQQTEGG